MTTARPHAAVFRHAVLHASETFVKNQVESMRLLEPTLFGVERVDGLVPDVRTALLRESGPLGALRAPVFQLTRRSGWLRRAMARTRPDVVVAHFAQDAWRIAPTARRLGVPLVVMCHGSDVLMDDDAAARAGRSNRQLVGHWPDLADAAALFVASSQLVADALVARGVPAEKVVMRYLGVRLPAVPSTAGGAREGVLSVGRLIRNKGGADLLRAHTRVVHARPGTRLTFVGEGSERGALEALARELGLADVVRFEGLAPPERVAELMESCAVLAAPSIPVGDGTSESFGQVVVEAGSRLLPVVAYATGGLPEAVGAGDDAGGVLVPTGDVDALASAIDAFLGDPVLVAETGRRGRARAERLFELDACTRAIETAVLSVVERGRS